MHPWLLRQMSRSTDQPVPAHLVPLLRLISDFYREVEQERTLLENALRVNSEELTALNDKLRASAEQELASQRALLHEIIDAIPDPIFIKNTESVYQVCNRAVAQLFGAPESEIIGRTDDDFVEAELAALFQQRDREVLARARPSVYEESIRHPDGRKIWLETLKTPYFSADGVLLGLIGIGRDITERKRSEAALLESEQRFRDLLEFAPIGMGVVTLEGHFLHVNQALCKLLGHAKSHLEGMPNRQLVHPEDYPACLAQHKRLFRGEIASVQHELRLLHREGREVWVNLSVVLQRDACGNPRYFIGQMEDVTLQRELRERDRFMAGVLDNVFDGVVTLDERNLIGTFNKAAERIFGYTAAEVIGQDAGMLMPVAHRHQHAAYVQQYCATGLGRAVGMGREVVGRRKDGGEFPLEISVSEIKDGNSRRFIGIVRDITERKSAEERVKRLAHYDVLTDLPNRMLFEDRLSQALVIARRDHLHVALMFVDLDNFKPVNDTYGHQVGDLLLKEVACRLRQCLRDSDTAARIGGDEFVVLLPIVEAKEDATLVAEKIRFSLSQPFELAGLTLHISASIGVAVNMDAECDGKYLIRKADVAMYRAKDEGRNRVYLYHPDRDGDGDWVI